MITSKHTAIEVQSLSMAYFLMCYQGSGNITASTFEAMFISPAQHFQSSECFRDMIRSKGTGYGIQRKILECPAHGMWCWNTRSFTMEFDSGPGFRRRCRTGSEVGVRDNHTGPGYGIRTLDRNTGPPEGDTRPGQGNKIETRSTGPG